MLRAYPHPAKERICDIAGDLGADPIDGLASLIDKSLLRKHPAGERESRFAMLETIREETAWSLMHLGSLMLDNGDTARAQTYFDESLALFRLVGNRWGTAMVHVGLGRVAQEQGQYAQARAALEEGLALLREFGDRATAAWAFETLGLLALYQQDLEQATGYYAESIALCRAVGAKIGFASYLEGLGGVALARGQVERAARLWGAAEAICEATELGHSRVDRRHNQEMVGAGRAALGAARFEAAWAAGRALPLEQALAYALRSEK